MTNEKQKLRNIFSLLAKGRRESVVERAGNQYYVSVLFGTEKQADKAHKGLEKCGVASVQNKNKILVEQGFSRGEVLQGKQEVPQIFWSASLA